MYRALPRFCEVLFAFAFLSKFVVIKNGPENSELSFKGEAHYKKDRNFSKCKLEPALFTLDEKLDLHIQQMWCKYKANATFDHVCSNLLLSVGPTLPHFYTQSKTGKCHICHTFATVSKSTDNMFFFTTFGCVAILMPNEAFCKYFARSFKFDLKIIFLYIFSMRAKLIKIVGFVHIC